MKSPLLIRCAHVLAGVLLAGSATAGLAAAESIVPFTSDRWDLREAAVSEQLGRSALAGTAWLKDVVFADGVIEVDLAVDGRRAYPAVVFRRQAEGEYEHVYVRPHRAGQYPDAIQYAPAFHGVAGWQLYSGPGFTAALALPAGQWVHLRIEVAGTQARVFVGGAAAPALVIDDLKHGRVRGSVGLAGPRDGSAFFSNFTCTADAGLRFAPPAAPDPVPGVIADWELSPVSRVFDIAPETCLDGKAAADIAWLRVKGEATGLVDIARHRQPLAGGASKIWARTVIAARQREFRPISLGYSDDVAVYLNGRLLYRGRSGFRSRDPSYLGIIGWNDTVVLPLEAGPNELVLMIAESFGGWGFMVRDLDAIYRDPALEPVWELAGRFHAPESVAYDSARQVVYVSNFGDDCISKVGLDGTVLAYRWIAGVKAPTGLRMHAGHLYAVERPGIAEIDPDQGTVVARLPIADAAFVNDLAIADDGAIYVSDSARNRIHRLRAGKSEVWLDDPAIGNPNGIQTAGDRLLVGVTADGAIKAVDLATRRITTLQTLGPGANMDGLVADSAGGILFSDYYGRIYRADAAGRRTLLLDRRGPHQYTADFEYIPEKHLVIVPSLYDNRLTAYRLAAP